ncbi:hypothetical protein GCM10027275_53520 [Rhabdobacter roseus]
MLRLILVLLGVWPGGTDRALARDDTARFAEKVNLALRRTAHQLLTANGDSTTRILPVQQPDEGTFVLRLNDLFDYDQLPQLLQESLELHGIHRAYDVAVLDCSRGTLQLGYSWADLHSKDGVPCHGRQKEPGCYQLRVSFYSSAQTATTRTFWWLMPLGTLLTALGYLAWRRTRREPSPPLDNPNPAQPSTSQVPFGGSLWDTATYRLVSGESTYHLTYREAKLLTLLVSHPNQVLERDFILKTVWEDEGVIVGRSLDVFVSRLRKMLRNDPKLSLVAVHGLGYRLEVLS